MRKSVASLILATLFISTASGTGVVNNSGGGPEDSITVPVINCDSLGNPTYADSFFVLTTGPSGDSVFAERITVSSARLDSSVLSDVTVYRYRASVADIDGLGQPGVYALTIIAQRDTPLLRWMNGCQFQVVASDFDDQLSIISELLDSLQSQAIWVARQAEVEHVDGFDPLVDSVLTKNPEYYRSTLSAGEIADTLFGRDSDLFDAGYWHKVAASADSGAAGSGSDSTSIARWIWNTPQQNHQGSGTFGAYLDAPISGLTGGGGAITHAMVAYDSTSQLAIPGARIAVRNLTQTALLGIAMTDIDGHASLNLDAGQYLAVVNATGFLFQAYDTIQAGSGLPDTVYGRRFDPGTPLSPGLCRVYGFLYGLDGTPQQAADVQAYLPGGVVRFHDLIVSPFSVSSVTDETGYFYFDLIPSDSLTPAGSLYEFTIRRDDGTVLRQRLSVPATSHWSLTW